MVEVTILARSLRPFGSEAGSIPLHKLLYVIRFLPAGASGVGWFALAAVTCRRAIEGAYAVTRATSDRVSTLSVQDNDILEGIDAFRLIE
jgi:hypothetical protein